MEMVSRPSSSSLFCWSMLVLTLPEINSSPLFRPLEKGDSYWKPSFSGAKLVLGSVTILSGALQ